MGERRGTKALELWCRRMTDGYPGVKIENMTTSWRDGLAFCAMIHHFRPDLIEFSKLNKNEIYHNNELAFRIAEVHLGIPALLEPEDMVEYSVPDRLSILTYLSQFYQTFAVNQSNSAKKVSPKRTAPSDLQMHMVSASTSSPPKKIALHQFGARREPCAKCGLPVFIAERLNVGKTLYHRTCFRCARCNSQLTLANYYETESNEFCCETCPDEEKSSEIDANILNRSLSDEEKSASLKGESDLYSANFENVLEDPDDSSLKRNFTLNRAISSHFETARSEFMITQMDHESSSSDSEAVVENEPKTETSHSLHSENTEVVCSDPLPSSSFSTFISKQNDQDISDRKLYESQDPVTKDSISKKFQVTAPSVKSRIKLFEGGGQDCREISKSDVNKNSFNISEVPYNEPTEQFITAVELLPNEENSKHVTNEDKSEVIEESLDIGEVPYDTSTEQSISVPESLPSEGNSKQDTEEKASADSDLILSSSDQVDPKDNSESYEIDSVKPICDDSDSIIVISSDDSQELTQDKFINSSDVIIVSVDDSVINISSSYDEKPESPNNFKEKQELSPGLIEYPEDLNPFDDDAEELEEANISKMSKSVSLNPFGDSDEEDVVEETKPQPAPRKITPISTNPFGSDDEEEDNAEELVPMTPQPTTRKRIKASKISLAPYWGDSPVPKPRSSRSPSMNISETSSLTGSGRKKKPAPKPPTAVSVFSQEPNDSSFSSLTSSPSQSANQSPKGTVRSRKSKRAPLPPSSTPFKHQKGLEITGISPIEEANMQEDSGAKRLEFKLGSEENLKNVKDEANRNRQHNTTPNKDNEGPLSLPDKSTYGKWKRRKGLAPARPVAQKRAIKSLPINEIRHELELIEIQQLGLEKQGVKLETLIRDRSEAPGANQDEALAPEVEDMVMQLFELVNEKNELFRRQTELMYLRRQHRLEVEQADLEYQIRCLILKPDVNKTDSDKALEEELINRLMEIVDRRNEIVDCLELDRQREAEEDTSIRNQMSLFSVKRDEDTSVKKKSKKEKHKRKKDKEKKSKSKSKTDIDKDIDETEISSVHKEKKKKKIFSLF